MFYCDQEKEKVFRMSLSDRKEVQIADLSHIDQPSLPFWPAWVGLAPDGTVLVMHDVGTKEIYALELEK